MAVFVVVLEILAIVGGVAVLTFVAFRLSYRGTGGVFGGVRRGDVLSYARRYRKRFPDTRPEALRESLREKFVPQRIGRASDEDDLRNWYWFGLAGWLGEALGRTAAVSASDAEILRVKDLIDEVVGRLYADADGRRS